MEKEHFLECLGNKQKLTIMRATASILQQYSEFSVGMTRNKKITFHKNILHEINAILETLDIHDDFEYKHLTVLLHNTEIHLIRQTKKAPYRLSVLELAFTPLAYTHFDAKEYKIVDKQRKIVQLQSWYLSDVLGNEQAEEVREEMIRIRKNADITL